MLSTNAHVIKDKFKNITRQLINIEMATNLSDLRITSKKFHFRKDKLDLALVAINLHYNY